MVISFVIATFIYFLSLSAGVYNLVWNYLLNGTTMVEKKHKLSKKYLTMDSNPFDYGFKENWKHIFGSNPLGWFLPLPTQLYTGNAEQM